MHRFRSIVQQAAGAVDGHSLSADCLCQLPTWQPGTAHSRTTATFPLSTPNYSSERKRFYKIWKARASESRFQEHPQTAPRKASERGCGEGRWGDLWHLCVFYVEEGCLKFIETWLDFLIGRWLRLASLSKLYTNKHAIYRPQIKRAKEKSFTITRFSQQFWELKINYMIHDLSIIQYVETKSQGLQLILLLDKS